MNNREYAKNYYLRNKQKYQERAKKYYQENKEKYKERNKRWRIKNKEKYKKYLKQWKEKHPDKDKLWSKQYRERHREEIRIHEKLRYEKNLQKMRITKAKSLTKRRNNPKLRYIDFKKWAGIRNLSFDITYKDFLSIWGKPCYYCGEKREIGLDRIDSNKGYSFDNVLPCCPTCNLCRRNIKIDKFINQCKKIADFHSSSQKDRQKFIDALIWCSGSGDFQVGGKARKGWEKICLPLLEDKK